MKKFISGLLTLCLLTGTLTGCQSANTPEDSTSADGTKKLQVVTTIFPEYDWVRQIVGENIDHVNLSVLQDNQVDLHSFQPTMDDIITISNCDVFLYVGGESDRWVDDILADAMNKDMVVINLLEVLGDAVKVEEIVEGMEAHEHDHEHEEEEHQHEDEERAHEEEHDHTPEYDEHVWLSLKNAKILCTYIGEQLGGADAPNATLYKENAAAYVAELDALDAQYQTVVNNAAYDTFLFGDRFPFRYMVEDYGLNYYAAFAGCSAESEASFETIIFLANKVNELHLPHVLIIENGNQKIAKTVVNNTTTKDQTILALDSMQSVSAERIAAGATYISIMEQNLTMLEDALN